MQDSIREYTIAETAALLGLTPGTVKDQIARDRMQARKIGKRLHVVTTTEIERYRHEYMGSNGWSRRKEEGYVPSPMAQYMKDYRARRKAKEETHNGQ